MSDPVHDYLAGIGRKGGAAGRGPAKARSSEQARKAALARWMKRKTKARAKRIANIRMKNGKQQHYSRMRGTFETSIEG